MDKFYITFGQAHTHRVNGKTFDKNCLCEIEAESHEQARERAFEVFDGVFCTSYGEDKLDEFLPYFPRGIIKLEN